MDCYARNERKGKGRNRVKALLFKRKVRRLGKRKKAVRSLSRKNYESEIPVIGRIRDPWRDGILRKSRVCGWEKECRLERRQKKGPFSSGILDERVARETMRRTLCMLERPWMKWLLKGTCWKWKSICGIHSETWMPRNCLAKIEFNPWIGSFPFFDLSTTTRFKNFSLSGLDRRKRCCRSRCFGPLLTGPGCLQCAIIDFLHACSAEYSNHNAP